jgi:hypothetical protein
MDRRQFLTSTGALIAGATVPTSLIAGIGTPNTGGWVPSYRDTINWKTKQRRPYFAQQAKPLAGSGKGKRALLWKFFEQVSNKKLVPHKQGSGDCVSHAFGLGIDVLNGVQVAHGKGEYKGKVASEIIYAGGRVEIAGGKLKSNGMHGSWGAKWCRDGGVLLRKPYLDGKYDFTHYSAEKARTWGTKSADTPWGGGVPDELEPLCEQHTVKTVSLVTTWEQARDSIYNGYPVVICSSIGFRAHRDRDGFADRWGRWYHSMLLCGMDDTGSRPGGLFINSWGLDWIDGPMRLEQPMGSFWADARTIDAMLRQDDSYAISNYIGYPKQQLDYKMY